VAQVKLVVQLRAITFVHEMVHFARIGAHILKVDRLLRSCGLTGLPSLQRPLEFRVRGQKLADLASLPMSIVHIEDRVIILVETREVLTRELPLLELFAFFNR